MSKKEGSEIDHHHTGETKICGGVDFSSESFGGFFECRSRIRFNNSSPKTKEKKRKEKRLDA